jgi:hypothetical protein
MWLVSDFTPADIDDPQPGAVIAGRIEADHLGAPFKLGALLVMQILGPADLVSTGTLYILDDGSDVAIVRLQGESPDLGLSIASQAMAARTAAPWPGADGTRERQSRFNRERLPRPNSPRLNRGSSLPVR